MESIVTNKIRETVELTEDDDRFGFPNLAKHLFEYIKSKEFPISVGIYGKWGSGKSVMGHFMQRYAEKAYPNEFEFIKFDAVQFKDSGDSIFWFLIGKLIKKFGIDVGKIKTGFFAVIKGLASSQSNKIKTVSEIIKNFASEEEMIDQLFSKIQKKSIKKYVIIIDNLDRLLPTETINFLEQLKSYLLRDAQKSLKNFSYLILCDFNILEEEVKSIYKTDIDVRDYLNKLIEVPFYIPTTKNIHLEAFVVALISNEIEDKKKKLISAIFGNAKLETPRDIKNFLLELDMIFVIAKARGHSEDYLIENLEKILALQILKAKYIKIFHYIIKKRADFMSDLTLNSFFVKSYQFFYPNYLPKNHSELIVNTDIEVKKLLNEASIAWQILVSSKVFEASEGGRFLLTNDIDRLAEIVDSATENINVTINEEISIN